MPDVKWFSGGGSITISTTTVSGGTNNRLLRQTSSVVGNSLLSDDGTNVTLSSGQHLAPNGADATPAYGFTNETNAGLWNNGSGGLFYIVKGGTRALSISNSTLGIRTAGSVAVGTGSDTGAAVASPYLFIGGVSGAGGTPVESNLTAGSGVALYTQQTHDAAATKFVIAYNLGGSMRYLVATLDGTTTTWAQTATRP